MKSIDISDSSEKLSEAAYKLNAEFGNIEKYMTQVNEDMIIGKVVYIR